MRQNQARQLYLAAAMLAVCFSQQASALIINDNYEGASSVKSNGTSYGDVIGSTNDFQINYIDASFDRNTNILSVSIDTTFGGKGDNGLFSSYTNTDLAGSRGIGYGDLFLSNSWTPYNGSGGAPYAQDDYSNGTVWSYGFSLDDRWATEDISRVGTLYSLDSGDNSADTYLSDDFLSSSTYTYRNGQEVAVNTDTGKVTAINNGKWITTAGKINFEIDLTGTSLLNGSEIAFHWGMTCGNDVIESRLDTRTVPEPEVLGLMLLGLISIWISRRKQT